MTSDGRTTRELIFRFAWGYHHNGYQVLARSEGLDGLVLDQALAAAGEWRFDEAKQGLLIRTIGRERSYLMLMKIRTLSSTEGARRNLQRNCLLVDEALSGSLSLSQWMTLLPVDGHMGVIPSCPPPSEVGASHIRPGDEILVAQAWYSIFQGERFDLPPCEEREATALLDALWLSLPPWIRTKAIHRLGLASSRHRGSWAGVCSAVAPDDERRARDPLPVWFQDWFRRTLFPQLLMSNRPAEHIAQFWREQADDLGKRTLDLDDLRVCAKVDEYVAELRSPGTCASESLRDLLAGPASTGWRTRLLSTTCKLPPADALRVVDAMVLSSEVTALEELTSAARVDAEVRWILQSGSRKLAAWHPGTPTSWALWTRMLRVAVARGVELESVLRRPCPIDPIALPPARGFFGLRGRVAQTWTLRTAIGKAAASGPRSGYLVVPHGTSFLSKILSSQPDEGELERVCTALSDDVKFELLLRLAAAALLYREAGGVLAMEIYALLSESAKAQPKL